MAVRFQDQLGDALRLYQGGQFIYKAPDGIAANWRPADWLLCRAGRFIAVEAKQCRTNAWAFADWTPQQRAASEIVERSGGLYWLVINWRGPSGTKSADTKTAAIPGHVMRTTIEVAPRKSLTWDILRNIVPSMTVPWVPGKGWNVEDFLTIGV